MAEDYSIYAKITGDSKGFESAVKSAQGSIGNFQQSFSKLQKMVGVGFAIAGIQKFASEMNEMAKLYVIQEKAEKSLAVAAKNNPYLDSKNVDELKKYASQLQSISEVGDEQLLPLMSKLAAAGRTQAEIQNIMTAAVDASATGAISLESAVTGLNSSYEGNVGQLRRLIPSLADLSDEELKSGVAVDTVAKAYKGMAEETASSSKQLSNSIGDLKEQLGYGWETAMSPMRKGLKAIIDQWTEALKKANEAKQAMTNLENVKAGKGGDVGKASATQTDLLIQQKIELDEYVRLAQLSAKKKKELTKKEQAELFDLRSKYLDQIRVLYQAEGETDLQAINNAVSVKTAAYQKSFEEEKQLVAQHQQELADKENERTENERRAQQTRLNNLRAAFDQEIAEYRQEIALRRQTGEEISEEQENLGLLTVARSAYIKMIKNSNGELQKDAQRLQLINDIIKELTKTEEEATDATEEYAAETKNYLKNALKEWGDFGEAVLNVYGEIEEEASSWTDFFVDSFHQFGELGKQAIETIGESLVEGEDAWNNLGVVALETIAKILEALAAELAARAAVNAATWNYAGAAVAAAGAAAALAGAGALRAVASQMKSVADSAADTDTSLKSVKETIKKIKESTKDFSSFASGFIDLQKKLDAATEKLNVGKEEFNKSLSQYTAEYESIRSTYQALFSELYKVLKSDKFSFYQPEEKTKIYRQWLAYKQILDSVDKAYNENISEITDKLKKLQDVYDEVLTEYNVYAADTLKTFKETNEELVTQIDTMNLLLSKVDTGSNIGNLIAENIKNGVLNGVYEARNSLIGIGSEMADVLFSQIAEGGTETTFLSQMKKNITETVLKLTVYTESLSEKITSISKKIIDAIYSENTASLQTAKNEMKTLWKETQKDAENALSFINEVFGDIADEIDDTTDDIQSSLEKILETFKSEIGDLGGTLADEIVNGLSEGLTGAEFMQNMKDYIRKMVVQSVVYTESLKAEIEAIGKAISTGITEGFTETGLHEIKRDLSYVFDQANRAISKVDTMFSSVFNGYATGTENAAAGLHLVGEAGPELVRFRGGEQVLNAQATNRVLEGAVGNTNNFNVTFNNLQDTTAFTMMQQMKGWQRQLAVDSIL